MQLFVRTGAGIGIEMEIQAENFYRNYVRNDCAFLQLLWAVHIRINKFFKLAVLIVKWFTWYLSINQNLVCN